MDLHCLYDFKKDIQTAELYHILDIKGETIG
jgi:hypothetical protein